MDTPGRLYLLLLLGTANDRRIWGQLSRRVRPKPDFTWDHTLAGAPPLPPPQCLIPPPQPQGSLATNEVAPEPLPRALLLEILTWDHAYGWVRKLQCHLSNHSISGSVALLSMAKTTTETPASLACLTTQSASRPLCLHSSPLQITILYMDRRDF